MTTDRLRILVSGSGGIGGVNFVHALRLGAELSNRELLLVGTEFNSYYINLPKLDVAVRSPRHSESTFIPLLKDLCLKYNLGFLHPNPSSEAKVVAENLTEFEETGTKTYLPKAHAISPDKEFIWNSMHRHGLSVPRAYFPTALEDIQPAFDKLGSPLWLRAKEGAGSRLSLKVKSPEEAELWIKLNTLQGRVKSIRNFFFQEFMPGRDVAFDSLWFRGHLISSSSRERIEYPLKHISLTGLTGTPSVAQIIHDDEIAKLGVDSVKALDRDPHGFYSTDMKEDDQGRPYVTEVDGKWHTTAPLWGYALAKVKQDNSYNVAFNYLLIGSGDKDPKEDNPSKDIYPEGYILIRQMDSGVLLQDKRQNKTWRILD